MSLNRASWTVIKMDEQHKLQAYLRGPVWSTLPQTSQAGEYCAGAALAEVAEHPLSFRTDCKGLSDALAMRPISQLHPSRYHAGLLRSTITQPGYRYFDEVVKVPAHVEQSSCHNREEKFNAAGNSLADEHARLARDVHPKLNSASLADSITELKLAKEMLGYIPKVLAKWPQPTKEQQQERRLTRQRWARTRQRSVRGARMPPKLPHCWSFSGMWRCGVCFTTSLTDAVKAARCWEECPGYNKRLKEVLDYKGGHVLSYIVVEEQDVVLCTACGSWMTKLPGKLLAPCPGAPPNRGSKYDLNKLKDGRHPKKLKVQGTRPEPVGVV